MSDITQERRDLFRLLNGDIFYPVSVWPKDIKLLFWKKPIGDTDTFKLLLFFLGNGCSPDVISQWILTSQHWADHKNADKPARQISFIRNNLTSKGHIWFYYDIHHSEWLFLNGEKRLLNNQCTITVLQINSFHKLCIFYFSSDYGFCYFYIILIQF